MAYAMLVQIVTLSSIQSYLCYYYQQFILNQKYKHLFMGFYLFLYQFIKNILLNFGSPKLNNFKLFYVDYIFEIIQWQNIFLFQSLNIIVQMGNNTFQSDNESLHLLQHQFNEIRKDNNGKIICCLLTNQSYFLKQWGFINELEYLKQVDRINIQLNQPNNQNILRLVKTWTRQSSSFCSSYYKIYGVYEYPQITLLEQILTRSKQQHHFSECDLWRILHSCINALGDMKVAFSIHPSQIYILSDGILKLIHEDMVDNTYRHIINQNIYYSPEKITNFYTENTVQQNLNQKQSIFSLAMTLLHTATLSPLTNCYDYKKYKFLSQPLYDYIQKVSIKYSSQFVNLIISMLQINPNSRPSLIQINQIVNQRLTNELHTSLNNQPTYQQESKSRKQQKLNIEILQKQHFHQSAFQNSSSINYRPSYLEDSICNKYLQGISDYKNSINSNNSIKKYNNYCSEVPINNYYPRQNKENIFTDPKLLESIRKDLQQISSIKMSLPNLFQQLNKGQAKLIRMYEKNGNIYEGTILNGLKHGKGKLTYSSGSYYQGQFENDQINGLGILYYDERRPNYDGQWKNGNFHGKGNLYNENPVLLQSEYDYNNLEEIQDFWIKFEGQFKDNKKNGQGILTLSNGQTFEGIYINNQANGRGIFVKCNAQLIQGIWRHNRLIQVLHSN